MKTECGKEINTEESLAEWAKSYRWHLNDAGNIVSWNVISGRRGLSLRRIAKEGLGQHTRRRIYVKDGDPLNLMPCNLTYCNASLSYLGNGTMRADLPGGKHFIFSEEDKELVERYSWYINKTGYVCTDVSRDERYYLHRLITGDEQTESSVTDHINMDKTDNTRDNLRVVSHRDNMWNRGTQSNSISVYKGVSRTRSGKFSVSVSTEYIGTYSSEIIAAGVYNYYAEKMSKGFARLNDVKSLSKEEADKLDKEDER